MSTAIASRKITTYEAELAPWQREIFRELCAIIREADPGMNDDWKWGKPAFSHDGLVCFIWAFQKWVSFTFYQGALIRDRAGIFRREAVANDRNRAVIFTNAREIAPMRAHLVAYVREAVANNVRGRKVRMETGKRPAVRLGAEMRLELERRGVLEAFRARPPYQRRDYLNWIAEAQQPATREKRREQMMDELVSGDVYMGMKWGGGKMGAQ